MCCELLRSHTHISTCVEVYQKEILNKNSLFQHKFHSTCIQTWLTKNNTCPACRENVFQETEPEWIEYDEDSSDGSVDINIEIGDFTIPDVSLSPIEYSSEPDLFDVSVASDGSSESNDNNSNASDMSIGLWEYGGSPAVTLEIDSESGDSLNEVSDDSSDDVMNESQITVSSESDDESADSDNDGAGMVFHITSDESSDSDVLEYESSDSSD